MTLPVTDTNTDEPGDTFRSLMISMVLSWISVIRLMSFPFRDDPRLNKYNESIYYNWFVEKIILSSKRSVYV